MMIIEHGGAVLLEKRPAPGVWGGLWCFPEIEPCDDAAALCMSRYGVRVESVEPMHAVEHGFTHFTLTISPVRMRATRIVPHAGERLSLDRHRAREAQCDTRAGTSHHRRDVDRASTANSMNWEEIKVWRKKKRELLVARREAIPAGERNCSMSESRAISSTAWTCRTRRLSRSAGLTGRSSTHVSPAGAGAMEVRSLRYPKWWEGHATPVPTVVARVLMRAGVYDIPVPDGTEIVVPDMAVVPMNGFDARGYRLGYGGGFFDRTLAAAEPRPVAIGVSYEALRLETIFPQAHDVPMDLSSRKAAFMPRVDMRSSCSVRRKRVREAQLFTARAPNKHGYSSPACYAAEFPGYFGDTAGTDSKK